MLGRTPRPKALEQQPTDDVEMALLIKLPILTMDHDTGIREAVTFSFFTCGRHTFQTLSL